VAGTTDEYLLELQGQELRLLVRPPVFPPSVASILLARHMRPATGKTIADLSAGCGIHAILAARLTRGAVVAGDRSKEAVAVARLNAQQNGVGDRVRVYESDLFDGLPEADYDFVVFNLPQTPNGRTLSSSLARDLDGGEDGADGNVRAVEECGRRIKRGGRIVFTLDSIANPRRVMSHLAKCGFEASELARIRVPFRLFEEALSEHLGRQLRRGMAEFIETASVGFYDKMIVEAVRR